jgi:hypothetical protein
MSEGLTETLFDDILASPSGPLGSRISNMTDGKDPGEQPGMLIARI